MFNRLFVFVFIISALFVGDVNGQDDVDIEAIQAQALAQIEVDLDAIESVPEDSTPEFQRDLIRNRHITGYYAEMFLSNPAQFQWLGLAAYVSNEIGVQIGVFHDLDFVSTFPEEYNAVVEANVAVYASIYWQGMAYRNYGLDGLEQAYTEEYLTDGLIESWRSIDEGTSESIISGTLGIADYEQGVILQAALYDPYSDFFLLLSSIIDSPVPGQEAPFTGDNLADFDQRWDWTINALFPGWFIAQEESVEQIHADMLNFMINSEIPALLDSAVSYACEEDVDCITAVMGTCAVITLDCIENTLE